MSALARFYSFTPFCVFDGSNAADLVGTFNTEGVSYTDGCTASVVSTGAGTATIRFTNIAFGGPTATRDVVLAVGDCIPLNNDPYPVPTSVLNHNSTVINTGPASASKYGAFGEAVLGILAVGSTNIAVTIRPTQPDTAYIATAFLDGPALALGSLSLGTPVKTSASVVTVPVVNSGLLPITLSQATVSVHVTAPQA